MFFIIYIFDIPVFIAHIYCYFFNFYMYYIYIYLFFYYIHTIYNIYIYMLGRHNGKGGRLGGAPRSLGMLSKSLSLGSPR